MNNIEKMKKSLGFPLRVAKGYVELWRDLITSPEEIESKVFYACSAMTIHSGAILAIYALLF